MTKWYKSESSRQKLGTNIREAGQSLVVGQSNQTVRVPIGIGTRSLHGPIFHGPAHRLSF